MRGRWWFAVSLILLLGCSRGLLIGSNPTLGQVTFSPGSQVFPGPASVSLIYPASDLPVKLYYSLKPQPRTGDWVPYDGTPILVSDWATISALAFEGTEAGPTSQANYVVNGALPGPTFDPPPTIYYNDVTVSLIQVPAAVALGGVIKYGFPSLVTPGASLFLNSDGQSPLAGIFIGGSLVSTTTGGTYNFHVADPVLSPPPGTYSVPVNVGVATTTNSANLLLDTVATPVAAYSGPVTVLTTTTFYTKGQRTNYQDSNVVTGTYMILPGANITLTLQLPNTSVTANFSISQTSPLHRSSAEQTTITANVVGTTALTYQWYLNPGGTVLGTSNSQTLGTTNSGSGSPLTPSDLAYGTYHLTCEITDSNGFVYSFPDAIGPQLVFQVVP